MTLIAVNFSSLQQYGRQGAGCAAEADDCRVNELPVAQVCVWEDTQYLQLLASVSFLRAAPNMSPGAHGTSPELPSDCRRRAAAAAAGCL